jgi:AcrR family transcriptional regulator
MMAGAMTMPVDRRERKKRQTRATIQAAAIDLFAERGYRETTIAAIADAADVAVRTVTGHFPAKEDLLFADDPFAVAALAERLEAGGPALDAFRAWMADTMAALTAERSRLYWRQRLLRSRLILDNPELRGRARSNYFEHERVLAAALAAERGEAPGALAPRLVAATVISGVREVYATYEARAGEAAPAPEDLLALVDRVLAFARTGVGALDADA